jgi:hypothetical protein
VADRSAQGYFASARDLAEHKHTQARSQFGERHRLQQIVRQGSTSAVRCRRAMMIRIGREALRCLLAAAASPSSASTVSRISMATARSTTTPCEAHQPSAQGTVNAWPR